MLTADKIPIEVWQKLQNFTGKSEAVCRMMAAETINAWPEGTTWFFHRHCILLPIPQETKP